METKQNPVGININSSPINVRHSEVTYTSRGNTAIFGKMNIDRMQRVINDTRNPISGDPNVTGRLTEDDHNGIANTSIRNFWYMVVNP
jgi:hypothetical protein